MKDVLLVGNPNAGKTTLFNSLTRSNEHVGNWHGVTVDTKEKTFFVDEEQFRLVDTPGIYSLSPLSFEEGVAVKIIKENPDKKIINICDQNNIRRNLFLTLCLLEGGFDVVLAINEIDKKPIFKTDCQKLSQILGIDVVKINAQKKIGLDELKKCLRKGKSKKNLPYSKQQSFKENIKKIDEFERKNDKNVDKIDKICENANKNKTKNEEKNEILNSKNGEIIGKNDKNLNNANKKEIKKDKKNEYLDKEIKNGEKSPKYAENGIKNEQKNEENDEIFAFHEISKIRYAFIDEILEKCAVRTNAVYGQSKLDKIFLNKWLAFPMFLCILAGIFYLTFFSFGAFLSDLLGRLLQTISSPLLQALKNAVGQSFFVDLFEHAVLGGVGTVLSFLPQVVLLFFFLSILEDSGYMSRIAFIFEDILGRVGLSGKSIYTLLMGFGCSTSAIMTSRNMDDKNAKIKTAILCPYMSCSAKIPIYTVIGGAFFGAKNIFVIMGLYFLGVFVAILISKILDLTLLKSERTSFILEFPPYRLTSLSRIGKILWKNVREFLVKVGSVMISMNIIVWILSSFSFSFRYVAGAGEGTSMLEQIGRFIAPIFTPLGFGNWAIVSSLLAGMVAKEVVVSSIAMFNGIDLNATKLLSASILLPTSAVFFPTQASVISFLVFCLLYTPCMASISMLLHEIGKKWTAISICIQLFTAYVLSFVIYNLCFAIEIFGFWKIFVTILGIFAVLFAIFVIYKKIKKKNLCTHCTGCEMDCKQKREKRNFY